MRLQLTGVKISIAKIFILCIIFIYPTLRIYCQQGWILQNTNTNKNINQLFFVNLNTGFAVGNESLLLKTVNSGQYWTQINNQIPGNLRVIKFFDINNGVIFSDSFIYRTTNSGNSWSLVMSNVHMVDCSLVDENTLYASLSSPGGSCITHTTDKGSGWSLIYPLGPIALKISFINPSTGFGICFLNNPPNERYDLYKTNDELHWNFINSFSSQSGYGFSGSLYFVSADTGFYSLKNETGNHFYRYINGVYNQSNIDHFQNGIFFINGKTGWAVCDSGIVCKTTNGGINWSSGFTPANVTLNSIQFLNNLTGWACGANGVIMKTTDGGLTSINQDITNVCDNFSLMQNYPNPFNPNTKIKFDIPNSVGVAYMRPVQLKIYDALGREVVKLVDRQMQPGSYSVEWDASAYASGVYFYQLSIDNEQLAARKMILIK